MEELITYIKSIAEKRCCYQDDPEFCAFDYMGSNVDDAHGLGMSDGEVAFARQLVAKFNL